MIQKCCVNMKGRPGWFMQPYTQLVEACRTEALSRGAFKRSSNITIMAFAAIKIAPSSYVVSRSHRPAGAT